MSRTAFVAIALVACGASSTPSTSTEETSAPTSEATATAPPEETATAAPTTAPEETATAKATGMAGVKDAPPATCTELPKKKCMVTRGCAWNDLKKCLKEENAP